jgi:glycosyltransferase involved in cell wall biosynthesis
VEPWKGFAAQKNSALDKCTGDWILSLDADEEVSEELGEEIGNFKEWRARAVPAELLPVMQTATGEELQARLEQLYADPEQRRRLQEHHAEFEQKYRYLFRNKHTLRVMWRLIKESRQTPEGFGVGIEVSGVTIPRKNFFLGKWVRRGGFYPDQKLRLLRKGSAKFQSQLVHETASTEGAILGFRSPLIHHAYPTLTSYIEHMNRYSSLGAEMVVEKRGKVGFSLINILLRPWATFVYNYFFRLGLLDGKEGLLLHLYHAVYVSWKYAKAWEVSRKNLQS